MNRRAWLFVWFVFASGALFSVAALPLPELSQRELLTFGVLTVLATAAQLFKAEGPDHQLYYSTRVFQFAAILLVHPIYYILLVAIAHVVEWAKERWTDSRDLRRWYLQPFNIATHIVAGLIARGVYLALNRDFADLTSTTAIVAIICAAVSYVILNHVMVGVALILARGVSLRASGIMTVESLLPDLINMALGSIVAIVWGINPVLMILAASPLVLVHRALQVPRLRREATTDSKTGLWTARHFMQLYTEELQRAGRFNRPLSFIMADLDLLRNINNTYGHIAGDVVLAGVAQVIRSTIRAFDIAGRFGGEEFAIVLPETTAQDALKVAEALRLAVEHASFKSPTTETPIRATLSLGVASFPDDAQVADRLVHAADVAVYQAKLLGRNRTVGAFDVPHAVDVETLSTDDRLKGGHTYPTTYVVEPGGPPIRGLPPQTPATPAQGASADGAQQANAQAARAKNGPALLPWFAGAVILAAAIIGLAGQFLHAEPDWAGVAVFAALGASAELFQADLFGEGTAPTSVALLFAAAFVGGIPGVVVTSLAVGLTRYVRRRQTAYKAIFSWAAHIISGSLAAAVFNWLALPLTFGNALILAIPLALVAIVYFLVDSGLSASAIALENGAGIIATWRQRYEWLSAHYVVLCVTGILLSAAYLNAGLIGVIIFGLPALMIHYAQMQYVGQTRKSADELSRLNEELWHANQQVRAASGEIEQLNEELFLTIGRMVDARDPYVSGHASRVAEYALAVGKRLDLGPDRLKQLEQAALLHDIGKLGISDQILFKPDKLTSEEYEVVRSHAIVGADILESSSGLRRLAPFVRHHHEWWNGSGYPYQRQGEQIPAESRIIAICDALESMVSDRPYHRAMALPQVIAELRRCAGTQFDPSVVDATIAMLEGEGKQLVVNSAREVLRKRENIEEGGTVLSPENWVSVAAEA